MDMQIWSAEMIWTVSHRADQKARVIADRHYNRQKPGTPQFVPPGRCFVLRQKRAVWVTSWPFAEYVKHEWGGAWVNSLFRRQGGRQIASEMIRDAVAATRWFWPETPALGMITFVDQSKVRQKSQPGRCYLEAGFKYVGKTKGGLLAFQMLPAEMPEPQPPLGEEMSQTHNQLVASHEQMDLDEAQERVQRILHGQAGPTLTPQPQTQPQAPAPRKKRSDAGILKGPKKPTEIQRGWLTVEQVAHLSKLIEASVQADNEAMAAQGRALNASVDLHSYLDELTIDSPGRSK